MTDTWFSGIFPGSKRPAEIDTTVAHPARVYDYWLGGKDNFAADREAAERVLRIPRDSVRCAPTARSWPARCATWPRRRGPPVPRHRHRPAVREQHPRGRPGGRARTARVVYVDNDPIVLAHARALLTSTPEGATAYLEADLRDTRHHRRRPPAGPWISASPSRSCCWGFCT